MTTSEVHIAIYDLSQGMARALSAQFLGAQHAVDMIPHTAILAFGKEYFFGQGIEWCAPHEFRAARGIHPVEIQALGRTTRTARQFEEWCRAQAANGRFGMQSYDFFHRNCNNFTEEAARDGLGLDQGVPAWILELPQKFLQSPMGQIVRPMLENMQLTNQAPTNVPSHHFANEGLGRAAPAASASASSAATAAANPWANIPASSPAPQPKTNLLDKQTALLSTDTGVVKVCVDRLQPEPEQNELLTKLADVKASWTQTEIDAVHRYLRGVMESDPQKASFALMLLRLAVLRRPKDGDATTTTDNEECSHSVQLVASLLLEETLPSLANQSMAWCVLSNAVGSAHSPRLEDRLVPMIERALSDCDPSKEGANDALRQSAAAFLYNASRHLTDDADDEGFDPSEALMSVLLGCLEHLHEQADVETIKRMYMAVGQLLKSEKFGETAKGLVKDLGLIDDEIGRGKYKEVEDLAKEVAALLD